MLIQYYDNLKVNKNNKMFIEDINKFQHLFKTKKSFNDFKKTLIHNNAKFKKREYYIDSFIDSLHDCINCYIANDYKPSLNWYDNGFAPNFNKQEVLKIWDIENEDFKFNN